MSARRHQTLRKRAARLLGVTFVLSAAYLIFGVVTAVAGPIGMVCTNPQPSAPSFNLIAKSGYGETPDGNSIFMWSYANADAPGNGNFQVPGPVLCVTQGQTVTVHLTNQLPEPVSIIFPGQTGVSPAAPAGQFAAEAPAGGDVTYTFVAGQPGTYLYESGSDQIKQVEMGMYGALVVRPSGHPDWAYGDASTAFDPAREYILVVNEIDPELHHAIETNSPNYDFNALHNRYFTVNGREFPDTIQDNGVSWLPHQPYGALVRVQPYSAATNSLPALIRMVNAGELNHPYHPHGNHLRLIAQDGRLLPVATEHFAETIGSGQTFDLLFKWTDQDFWDPNTNTIPSPVPTYRNLMFKDGNTYYSGSPYLGTKGTLPATTVSQNVCGEAYFPWHSHALNEFTNFDEGFGGMATLLRVDPLGGCSAFPTSTKLLAGTLNSGAVGNLAADDTKYYKVNSTTTGTRTSDWYGQFSGISAGASNLKVTYKGNNAFASTAQNFNTLASSGTTSSTVPAGWAFSESGTGANTTYGVGTGSSSAANTYSFGAATSTDRAFGTLRGSGVNTFTSIVGAQFTNTTGGTITSLAISYTGEQWRLGATGSQDRLDFQYSTNATSLTTGTWSDVDSLDFSSPQSTGTIGAKNGNSASFRTAKSFTITGLSIAPGVTYRVRWTDFDKGGSGVADDGLAVDDFSLTPGGPTMATTVSIWNWATSSWTQLDGPTAVGATDVTVSDNTLVPESPVDSWADYVGTGANKGFVRVRVLTTGAGANFVTGGNLMKLVYDAP
jgi:hypothetical protein